MAAPSFPGPLSAGELRLEEIRQRAAAGDSTLSDQDKVAMVAHHLMRSVVLRSQEAGKIPKDQDPWEISVRLASKHFEKAFGRHPSPDLPEAGPKEATTAEKQLLERKESVERVTMMGMSVVRPKATRERAPTRELAAAALGQFPGALVRQMGRAEVSKAETAAALGRAALPLARGVAGTLAAPPLIIGNVLGLLSDQELDQVLKAIGGT